MSEWASECYFDCRVYMQLASLATSWVTGTCPKYVYVNACVCVHSCVCIVLCVCVSIFTDSNCVCAVSTVVQVLFSLLFQLPTPPQVPVCYGALFIELCKADPATFPQIVSSLGFTRLPYSWNILQLCRPYAKATIFLRKRARSFHIYCAIVFGKFMICESFHT